MKIILFIALVALPVLATDTEAPVTYLWGAFRPVKVGKSEKVILEPWFSNEGQARLKRSEFKNDFYQLAHHYQPQLTPVYAGVASSVIVLNAFRMPRNGIKSQKESEINKPKAMGGGVIPFPAYNQINFFNEKTDAVKDRKQLALQNVTPENENDKSQFKPGTSLDELKGLLSVYKVGSDVSPASEDPKTGLAKFRKVVKEVLKDKTRFLICNFKGDDMGASTEGTVSPLVAYDAKSDAVLILDVTGHKNPWYWAPLDAFYRSMHTQYGEGIWRGWLVVTDYRTI